MAEVLCIRKGRGGKGSYELDLNELLATYNSNGRNITAISRTTGISRTALRNVFINKGLPTDGKWRKYEVDDSYFSIIDSETKAYILGYLAADGWISKSYLGMNVKEDDVWILQLIRSELKTNIPLYHIPAVRKLVVGRMANCSNQKKFMISSTKLTGDLRRLGFNSEKSLTLQFPDIPRQYYPDFIRGYFDGDGSVYMKSCPKCTSPRPAIKVIGTESIMRAIQQEFQRIGIVPGKLSPIGTTGKVFYLAHNGSGVCRKIMDYMYYKPGLPALPRKKQIFDNYYGKLSSAT